MKWNFTNSGIAAMAYAAAEKKLLIFKKVVMGTGKSDDGTAVEKPLPELPDGIPIAGVEKAENSNSIVISATFDNSAFPAEKTVTEIGIYIDDPENDGNEILFLYGCDMLRYIPPNTSAYENVERFFITLTEGAEGAAAISGSLVFVTKDTFDAYVNQTDIKFSELTNTVSDLSTSLNDLKKTVDDVNAKVDERATKKYVDDAIKGAAFDPSTIDMSGYATKEDLNNYSPTTHKHPGYATLTYVNEKISELNTKINTISSMIDYADITIDVSTSATDAAGQQAFNIAGARGTWVLGGDSVTITGIGSSLADEFDKAMGINVTVDNNKNINLNLNVDRNNADLDISGDGGTYTYRVYFKA